MSNSPILLSPEQHAFVKANLATLLASEYSITNQSAGKLEYLTAVLMGYTNHHQRNAAIQSTDSAPIGSTAVETETLEKPFDFSACFTDADREALIKRGWWCWQRGDYEDYEYEITYENTPMDRLSFNLVLTFCHVDGSNCAYIILGDNFGDGVNTRFEFPLDSNLLKDKLALLESFTDVIKKGNDLALAKFCRDFLYHQDASNAILEEIKAISDWAYKQKMTSGLT